MTRILLVTLSLLALLAACASSSSSTGTSGDAGSCPSVGGAWKITAHCDATLIGQPVTVNQTGCSLAFAAPFNGFTGTVSSGGALALSGPQTCSGTGSASAITMTCTPGTCLVTLAR